MTLNGGPLDTGLTSVGISAARARVLNRLRSRPEPWGVHELSDDLDLHRNTVREHLTALVADGLAEYSEVRSAGPGRPARHYTATLLGEGIDYPELVVALAETISELPDSDELARRTGERWGRRQGVELQRKHPGIDLMGAMTELGFSPVPNGKSSYELRTCPVLVAARRNPKVVCHIHAGLVRALAEPQMGPVQVELLPLASPTGCILNLSPRPAA